MTVAEIVKKYLEENGFDGLAGDECGCSKDSLFPCDFCNGDCEPAYIKKCVGEKCLNKCDAYDESASTDCFSTTRHPCIK
jgi:hypothetical protein